MPDAEGTRYFRATYELPAGIDASARETARGVYLNSLLIQMKLRAYGAYENNLAAGLSILSVADAAGADAVMRDNPFVKDLSAASRSFSGIPDSVSLNKNYMGGNLQ